MLNLSQGGIKMPTQVEYLDHEVEIRVMKEVNEVKFREFERVINNIDNKLNWLIGFFLTSILFPIALHLAKLT
jgi:hypothetical protein